jgi:methylglutaconyl-CoA hydratase
VDEVVTVASRSRVLEGLLKQLVGNGPAAMAQAKLLLRRNRELSGMALTRFTAEQIADLRAGPEAQEGMRAFLEKRKPDYSV